MGLLVNNSANSTVWMDFFKEVFNKYYITIHRYETNRLRNIGYIARFFAHLFATNSTSCMMFDCMKINEDETTSSSRIFVKIMMHEMEGMGLKILAE